MASPPVPSVITPSKTSSGWDGSAMTFGAGTLGNLGGRRVGVKIGLSRMLVSADSEMAAKGFKAEGLDERSAAVDKSGS